MTTTQDFTPIDQLATYGFPTITRPLDTEADDSSSASAPSANLATIPAAAKEEDSREPLKELSEHSQGNNEVANQEQEQDEKSEQNTDKLNEYVTKVLEKLMKQKSSMAKLSTILDKKGLKYSQLQDLIQSLDEDSTAIDNDSEDPSDPSKENLSPGKARQAALKPEVAVAPQEKTALVPVTTQKAAPKYKLEDVLQISRKAISFGTRFPGQIVEEHLDIVNKSGQDFVVQIHVNCLNEELDNSDEYVFSVRRTHLYDYNDKHYLIMAPYSSASFKFALKVPNMKVVGNIEGRVSVGIQGLNSTYAIDLSASVTIPKVFCPKELNFRGLNYNVIKLAMKEGKKSDIKLPIRNNGEVPVTLELEFYEPKDAEETQGKAKFDCLVHPNVITINPNSQTLTNILVKPVKGSGPLKEVYKQQPARKILTGRVRDSALVYSFVFWIEFY